MPKSKRQTLAEACPEIASEWHQDKNGDLHPADVPCTSTMKAHWQCAKGHEWTSEVRTRVRGRSQCPYCKGMLATPENNLASKFPRIAAQWNFQKNGALRPEEFLSASMKRVWWICEKDHEWEAAINSRSAGIKKYAGNGCPYCSNRKTGYGNDIATTHPDLSLEWHPGKNDNLKPSQFTSGSHKKVWWKCTEGHEWPATITERTTGGTGCPYCPKQYGSCNGARLASPEYNFALKNPQAATEWLKEKNNNLAPTEVTPSSGRKFWFKCPNGHEYLQSLASRTEGRGCTYCAGKLVLPEESLAAKYPEIAAQWDYEKNADGPESFTPYSGQKVWWRCPKGKDHSWEVGIGSRTRQDSGCPYCAPTNRRVSAGSNLTVTHPTLMQEWDFESNSDLDPTQLLAGTDLKAAWKCARGHKWKAAISSRALSGRGCPKCRTSISRIELRVFSELFEAFGNVKHHQFIDGIECDILIEGTPPIAVEVDGRYWHRNKAKIDAEKNKKLASLGVIVVRVRDHQLGRLSAHDVLVDEDNLVPRDVANLIANICSISGREPAAYLDAYADSSTFRAEERFRKISDRLPLPPEGRSLAELHPDLAATWDHEKNNPIVPEQFTPGSKEEVWWRCPEGHSFQRMIYLYTKGTGRCPHCFGSSTRDFVPLKENSFGGVRPDLLASWHPTKNEVSTFEVTPSSNKLRWWVCDNGHEWETTPDRRQKYDCPY